MEYINYNREERDLCAHLFRLLLENQPDWVPLKAFLKIESVTSPRIFCEAALIRDAYFARKPNIDQFISDVCEIIAQQEKVVSYTHFRDLSEEIRNPEKTHPKQIKMKLNDGNKELSTEDKRVYGSLQAMFNAKPDLVICEGKTLYVFEAKYTLDFEPTQLNRTRQIAEVWQKVLYRDLSFSEMPEIQIKTLGLAKFSPDISWETVLDIAKNWWGENDFSIRVLSKVVDK